MELAATPQTVDLEIRKGEEKTILKLDDRIYIAKGAIRGDLECKAHTPSFTPPSYFTLILAADRDGNEYLISTENNIPTQIEKGSRNDIIGQGYRGWGARDRFYIDRFRTRLIRECTLNWAENGTMYINVH